MLKKSLNVAVLFCILILSIGVITLASCNTSKDKEAVQETAPAIGLAGDWLLTSMLSNGVEVAIPTDTVITFSADAEGNQTYSVYGFGGVNNYNASVAVDDGSFSAGAIGTTMVAGPEADEQIESQFLTLLRDSNTVSISDDKNGMVIGDGTGKNQLLFARMALDGSSWILVAYNNGSAVTSLPEQVSAPELTFGAEEVLSGFTGVNYLNGEYDADYMVRTIAFPYTGATRMAAPSQVAAVMEQNFLDLLSDVEAYAISGNTLTLLAPDGMTLLVFNKK